MNPSSTFFSQLKVMEAMFRFYHGEKELKEGKGCVNILSIDSGNHVLLPEVIKFFVKCRLFFSMRILNKETGRCKRKLVNKVGKLNK